MKPTTFVDAAQVKRRFARAAESYPQGDFLAREIDRRMQERLDLVRLEPRRVLDLGCSRGGSLAALGERYPEATRLAVDFVPDMLRDLAPARPAWQKWLGLGGKGAVRPIAADALALPLAAATVSLVWSNLLLHWLDDPLPALQEAHRVLEVDGLLMFTALGPDTLRELRAAFGDGYAHTQRFIDMHDYGDMLVACSFADPVMDMEVLTLTYDDFDGMLRELRQAGSSCAMRARHHGLYGRDKWRQVRQAYEALRCDGKLPATIEVIYGHAWKALPKKSADGRSVVNFMPRKG